MSHLNMDPNGVLNPANYIQMFASSTWKSHSNVPLLGISNVKNKGCQIQIYFFDIYIYIYIFAYACIYSPNLSCVHKFTGQKNPLGFKSEAVYIKQIH